MIRMIIYLQPPLLMLSIWSNVSGEVRDAKPELVDESGVAVDFVTKRCDTAESIADLKYSELFA